VGYDAFTGPAMRLEECANAGDLNEAAQVIGQLRRLVRRMVMPQDRSPGVAAP